MKISDQICIAAPQQKVWDALNDPENLKNCIEGCTKLDRQPDGSLAGTVQARIGPVRATFQGVVTISDVQAPAHYVLSGEGKGGVAGFAKGKASIDLTSVSGTSTTLAYEAEALVGGKLAQLGARLIESTARDYADKFFTRFRESLETPAIIATANSDAAADTAAATLPAGDAQLTSQKQTGLAAWIWAPLVVAALGVMAWYVATQR
jgi:uncharacterized protein